MCRVVVVLLLVILSQPFIHNANFFAAADYKLIQTICHYSEAPESCVKCVESSKEVVNDGVAIAIVIVNCINDKANTLASNMTKLANSTSDGKLKSIYVRCANDYGDHIAKKELISTRQALMNHNFDNAESCLVSALKIDLFCHSDLKSDYHDEVPSYVFDDMNIYEELSETASRIIEKLNG